jgi:hypothetical protein
MSVSGDKYRHPPVYVNPALETISCEFIYIHLRVTNVSLEIIAVGEKMLSYVTVLGDACN